MKANREAINIIFAVSWCLLFYYGSHFNIGQIKIFFFGDVNMGINASQSQS